MGKKFKLKTILSAISGDNIADDFNEVFELYWYVFDDPYITTTGLPELRQSLFEHLYKQYPDLYEARYLVRTRYGVLRQKYGDEPEILSIKEVEEEKTFVDADENNKKNTKKKNKK